MWLRFMSTPRVRVLFAALAGAWLAMVTATWALPTGGQVADGAATIQQPNGQTMTIHQHSDRALLNWQGFSIGQSEAVQFIQPSATSLAVNRVLGGDPSVILGQMLANGRVFLLNPNGVIFGPGAVVNVGGLLASTLNLESYDLHTGQFKLAQDPTKALAAVVNQGTLRAADHGFVVLNAPGVVNDGLIVAKFGQVGLGAGTQLAVDFRGDGLIQYAVDGKVLGQVTDPSGKSLTSAVSNAGRIEADGGTVLLTAQASSAVVSSVINQTGVVQARRLESQGGEIVLRGGNEGTVMVAGTLDARGSTFDVRRSTVETGEKGGTIDVRGTQVGLTETARLDVSGEAGGGTITVGGGFQGKDGGPNAQQTVVWPGATLLANAGTAGDGGTVIVWADGHTQFGGTISARGGSQDGNGGFAEVSGKESLVFRGTVDLQAAAGKTGTLLLDPKTITIQPLGSAYAGPYTFASNPSGSVTILDTGVNSLSAAINSANITLQANTDIIFATNANVTTTSSNGLTLNAGRSILFNINSRLSLNGGSFQAIINDSGAQAPRDGGTAQFVMNPGTQLLTNGGPITINVGSFGGLQIGEVRIGSAVGAATINSGAGAISITGKGHANAAEDLIAGIRVDGFSTIQSTTGAITLSGTGGAGHDYNIGVDITGGSIIQSSSGLITITGTGGAGRHWNTGVGLFLESRVETTTSGNISITGTGGAGGDSNDGVGLYNAGTKVATSTGALNVTGHGGTPGTGSSNVGIYVGEGVEVNRSGAGTGAGITFQGTGGSGLQFNDGINIYGLVWSANGPIAMTGTGGTGSGNSSKVSGIFAGQGSLTSGQISSTGQATITMNGTGGSGVNENAGILLSGAKVQSPLGAIKLTGTGGGTGTDNEGIILQQGAQVGAPVGGGSAPITLIGNGVGTDPGILTATSGPLNAIGGMIGGSMPNGEIKLQAGTVSGANSISLGGVVIQGSGNLRLEPVDAHTSDSIGLAGGTGVFNLATAELNAIQNGFTRIYIGRSDGTGVVTVGATGHTFSDPITIQSAAAGGAGSITVSGPLATNGSGDSLSLQAGRNILLNPTGNLTTNNGAIQVSANPSGTATGNFAGLDANGVIINAGTGSISLAGIGGTTGSNNFGLLLQNGTQVISSGFGAGAVTLTGSSGGGVDSNTGVQLMGAGTTVSSNSGSIAITGTGAASATGQTNRGIAMFSGAQVQSTGTATITLSGTGGGTVAGGGNPSFSYDHGVVIAGAGTQMTSAGGNITITGTGGGIAGRVGPNFGVSAGDGAAIQGSGSAGVSIVGSGGPGVGTGVLGGNSAIFISNGQITTVNGPISLNGVAHGTAVSNYGVIVRMGAIVKATGTGAITMVGQGSTTATNFNHGVVVANSGTLVQAANGGSIAITGTGGGNGTGVADFGVSIGAGATVQGTGNAPINIDGTGGNATSSKIGVFLIDAPTRIQTDSGNLRIDGSGDGITASNGFVLPSIPCAGCPSTSNVLTTNGIITITP